MEYLTFYNKQGKAIAWLSDSDEETIYLFDGKPVAWICGNSVYSFNGSHLGFFENGWIYDNKGYCVYFTQKATGGPIRPAKQICPARSITKVKPIKRPKTIPPINPIKKLSWSIDSDNFF